MAALDREDLMNSESALRFMVENILGVRSRHRIPHTTAHALSHRSTHSPTRKHQPAEPLIAPLWRRCRRRCRATGEDGVAPPGASARGIPRGDLKPHLLRGLPAAVSPAAEARAGRLPVRSDSVSPRLALRLLSFSVEAG